MRCPPIFLEGKKFNVNDLLADIELEQITKERHANNGNGSEREICWWAEGIVNGRRVRVHRPSAGEYTARQSALVFEAERIANQRVGDPIGCAAVGYAWNEGS